MIEKKAWIDYQDTASGVREAAADMIRADDERRERKRRAPARLESNLDIATPAIRVRL